MKNNISPKEQLLAQYEKSLSIIQIVMPIVIVALELLGIILMITLGSKHLVLTLVGLIPMSIGFFTFLVYKFNVRYIKSKINEIKNNENK